MSRTVYGLSQAAESGDEDALPGGWTGRRCELAQYPWIAPFFRRLRRNAH